jgi:hypothetical protein
MINGTLSALRERIVGRDSSVGIGTSYGLDGLGIEFHWVVWFSASVQTGRGSLPASFTTRTESFLGERMSGHGVYRATPSSAEVKEGVKLYRFSHTVPSWQVLGQGWRIFFSRSVPKLSVCSHWNFEAQIKGCY